MANKKDDEKYKPVFEVTFRCLNCTNEWIQNFIRGEEVEERVTQVFVAGTGHGANGDLVRCQCCDSARISVRDRCKLG